jgi:SAM-dependent methyltransferase
MNIDHKLPAESKVPTSPPDQQKQAILQQENRAWWENNPMRYDWNKKLAAREFSREFYSEIDRRFFSDAACYMPPKALPFDEIVPFSVLPKMDVLEIGVGNGSHAQLIAPHCKSFTGIDLTDYAASSTRRRFEAFGLRGYICQMDAERMAFADASFDFIWTWGVIHHSANTGQILAEMNRVLRPGGRATVMVYHSSFLYFYVFSGLFRGVLRGGFLKTRSVHELVQLHTDGAIARFYRPPQWEALVNSQGFVLEDLRVKGQKCEVFPLPASRFKDALMNATPSALSRFVLNTCRQGSFLITTLRKA